MSVVRTAGLGGFNDVFLLIVVEFDEFVDEGVFIIMVKFFTNPLVYGCLGKLLHEYVPVVEVRVDFAVGETFIVKDERLVD